MTIGILLMCCTVLLAIPSGMFVLEVICAHFTRRGVQAGDPPPFTVIVPAHNEAQVITATLLALRSQLRTTDKLLVVADNCSDKTAAVARAMGAEVTERNSLDQRGKGYALAHGIEYARGWNNPITIIVDADCHVEPGALTLLAWDAARMNLPVQGRYLITAPANSGFSTRFSAFAIRVKNHVRLLGCRALGVPCILTGSGMAFPTHALDKVNVGSSEIVEDLLLGIDLAKAGYPPFYSPQACIVSPLPLDSEAAETQRTRWESGYLSIMRRFVLPLLASGVQRGNIKLILLGLDLAVPPLSLLCMFLAVLFAINGLWLVLAGELMPFLATTMLIGLFGAAIFLAWMRYARDLLTLGEMALLPINVLKKIGFYLRMATRPKSGWVRTSRERPNTKT